jgi:hypothetical protein
MPIQKVVPELVGKTKSRARRVSRPICVEIYRCETHETYVPPQIHVPVVPDLVKTASAQPAGFHEGRAAPDRMNIRTSSLAGSGRGRV